MTDNIRVINIEDEFTICPDCNYDGGFHNIFIGLHSNGQTKWLLMCPNCKAKFDIGLRYFKPKSHES
jgi:hypothetical protein